MRGRLLERFQERVPSRRREHVHLVDYVNLGSVPRWAEAHPLLQATHLVDAVVAGAVDLLNVEILPGRDLTARCTLVARSGRRSRELAVRTDAVQALGEQACARCLADAADAREEKRVRNAPRCDRVRER